MPSSELERGGRTGEGEGKGGGRGGEGASWMSVLMTCQSAGPLRLCSELKTKNSMMNTENWFVAQAIHHPYFKHSLCYVSLPRNVLRG